MRRYIARRKTGFGIGSSDVAKTMSFLVHIKPGGAIESPERILLGV
jgi:hypothetical protein